MKTKGVGCTLVCDNSGRLSGLVTDRDIVLRIVSENLSANNISLKYVMTSQPVTLSEEQLFRTDRFFEDSLWLMRSLGIRRVPITSKKGRPLALIEFDTLLLSHKADLNAIADVIRKQIQSSAATVTGPHSGASTEQDLPPESLPPESPPSQEAALETRKNNAQMNRAIPSYYSMSSEHLHSLLEEQSEENTQSPRHRAHAEQTLGRLLHLCRDCLEEHNVFGTDKKQVLAGLQMFLRCLVRRVKPTEAANFIAQLPSQLHDMLLSEPAGPDQEITLGVLVRGVRKNMRLRDDDRALEACRGFAAAIELKISPGEVRSLCAQLPSEMKRLFEEANEPALSVSQRKAG
jgi:uncharacterized protein (DUF2267 family)